MGLFGNRENRNLSAFHERITPVSVFCTASILSLVVLLMCFVATRGELISRYFWADIYDTGMDFFHSIEYVRGRQPYEQFQTLYPPLANLFFLCIYFLVPVGVSTHWPSSFGESLHFRGTEWDLRLFQAPLLLFALVLIITAWMLVTLIIAMMKGYSYKQANAVALCILLSPGMLMAFERGNIVFIVVPLCMFFIHYRKSENWIVRELALIALALASGLKLYPAFFGVLLIKDRKYAQAVRTVVYGLLSVILPCFVFKEGLAGIPIWLSVVKNFSGPDIMPHIGTSFANILNRVALYAREFLGLHIPTSGFALCGMIVSFLLLVASVFMKKNWQSVLSITFAIIMFSANGQYIYSFVCVPTVFLLMEEKRFHKQNIIPFVLTVLLCVHLPLFHNIYGNYPDIAIKQLLSLLIVLWCLVTGITDGIRCMKLKNFWRKNNGNLEE
jgi:hypothetical protein